MVLLSAAVGINLGLESIRKIKSKDGDVKRELTKGLKLFSVLILPLLFVATLIESFITPFLLPCVLSTVILNVFHCGGLETAGSYVF